MQASVLPELEPHADGLERRARRAATASAALAQRHARDVVGLGDRPGVQRAWRSAAARRSARRSASSASASGDRLVAAAEVRERQRRGRAPGRPGRVRAALLLAQRAGLARLGERALEVALGEREPRAGVAHPDLPHGARARRRAGARAAGRAPRSNAPRSASAQTSTSSAPPVKTLSVLARRGRARAAPGSRPRRRGRCAAPARPRATRPPTRSRSEPRASASAHARDRLAGLVGPVGEDQRAGAQVVGRAPVRPRAADRRRRALRGPSPPAPAPASPARSRSSRGAPARRARAADRRSARGRSPRRGAPAPRGAGNHHQRVERRGLDGEARVGVALGGELLLEQVRSSASPASITLSAARRVSTSIRPSRSRDLAQRLAQRPARVGQAGVERDRGRAGRASPRGRRPARARRARARGRRPRCARRRAARPPRGARSSALTRVGLRAALEQMAGDHVRRRRGRPSALGGLAVQPLALGAGGRGDRGRDQPVREAPAALGEQARRR